MRRPGRAIDDLLSDIVRWGEKLGRYAEIAAQDDFLHHDMAVDAATKCIEVIGEAAGRILQRSPELTTRYPELQLREAYLTRNQLSHGYFTSDAELIWQMARGEVPKLVAAAKQVLAELESRTS
jgi:uncharacterized protein with HEPN domain